jgi:hypothetical protein
MTASTSSASRSSSKSLAVASILAASAWTWPPGRLRPAHNQYPRAAMVSRHASVRGSMSRFRSVASRTRAASAGETTFEVGGNGASAALLRGRGAAGRPGAEMPGVRGSA